MKAISSKSAHDGEFRSQETWGGYTGKQSAPRRDASSDPEEGSA